MASVFHHVIGVHVVMQGDMFSGFTLGYLNQQRSVWITLLGFGFFLILLSLPVLQSFRSIFLGRYGRRHRLVGLAYLLFLIGGYTHLLVEGSTPVFFHIMLPFAGVCLTVTAALDFEVRTHKGQPRTGRGTVWFARRGLQGAGESLRARYERSDEKN